VSSFLTAHQHIKGYFVPSNDRSDYSELAVQTVLIRFFLYSLLFINVSNVQSKNPEEKRKPDDEHDHC